MKIRMGTIFASVTTVFDGRGLSDPSQDHEVEAPQRDRGDKHSRDRVAVAEEREERAEGGLDHTQYDTSAMQPTSQ